MKILCIGEALIDMICTDKGKTLSEGNNFLKKPGGAPTNVAAAIAAYQETDYMKDALQKTIASREHLYGTLKKEGYDYIPSSANFVMFPLKMEGNKFVNEMFKRGVGVRNWKLNGADWCRVSIGRMDEMEAFAAAFKELS